MIIVTGSVFCGHLLFGEALEGFSNISAAFRECFQMVIGEFNYQDLQDADPLTSTVFFYTYMIVAQLLLLNIFFAIMDYYFKAQNARQDEIDKRNAEGKPKDEGSLRKLINKIKSLLRGKSKSEPRQVVAIAAPATEQDGQKSPQN